MRRIAFPVLVILALALPATPVLRRLRRGAA